VNSTPRPKTLLVLAASLYQLETIRTARALGYRVITSDNRPENPGHRFADRSYTVDTTDTAAVLALARQEQIDGLLAPCTDVALPTLSQVAHDLQLPGPPAEIAWTAFDKARFRHFLESHGHPCPQFQTWHPDTAVKFTGQRDWIVKPARSSGSKGVRIVSNAAELKEAALTAQSFSLSGEVVVEEFIQGHQGTCEGWLENGRIAWHCLLDRQTAPRPYSATHGHLLPTTLPEKIQRSVVNTIGQVWQELGVTEGPFDCDFVAQPDAVYLLELSPRLGGNSISQLIRAAYDFDLVARTIQWACGDTCLPLPRHPPRASGVILLGSDAAGRLSFDADQADALAAEPWVESLSWDVPAGTPVQPFIDGRHRVGQALLQARDRAELDARVAAFKQRLQLHAV